MRRVTEPQTLGMGYVWGATTGAVRKDRQHPSGSRLICETGVAVFAEGARIGIPCLRGQTGTDKGRGRDVHRQKMPLRLQYGGAGAGINR